MKKSAVLTAAILSIPAVLAQGFFPPIFQDWMKWVFVDVSRYIQTPGDQAGIVLAKFMLWILVFTLVYYGLDKVFKEKRGVTLTISIVLAIMGVLLIPDAIVGQIFRTYSAVGQMLFLAAPAVGAVMLWKYIPRTKKAYNFISGLILTILGYLYTSILMSSFPIFAGANYAQWGLIGGSIAMLVGFLRLLLAFLPEDSFLRKDIFSWGKGDEFKLPDTPAGKGPINLPKVRKEEHEEAEEEKEIIDTSNLIINNVTEAENILKRISTLLTGRKSGWYSSLNVENRKDIARPFSQLGGIFNKIITDINALISIIEKYGETIDKIRNDMNSAEASSQDKDLDAALKAAGNELKTQIDAIKKEEARIYKLKTELSTTITQLKDSLKQIDKEPAACKTLMDYGMRQLSQLITEITRISDMSSEYEKKNKALYAVIEKINKTAPPS